MYAKTINHLCAGNNVFVKYQAQGGGVNPNSSPCVRPCFRHRESFATLKRLNPLAFSKHLLATQKSCIRSAISTLVFQSFFITINYLVKA